MDSDAEWTTNENTIYGNAAMIFLTSAIMSQTTPDLVTGDVNADNKFNILDIILLKKWLLDISSTELANWKFGDLNHDDTLNILDLSLMKQKFIKENSANTLTSSK